MSAIRTWIANVSKKWNEWRLARKQNEVLGLDIQPEALKIMSLNHANNQYYADHLAFVKLPENAITHEGIKDAAAVATALRKLFRKANVTTRNVALAIPRSSAIIKQITVDSRLSSSEIESRAWVEANRHFPDLIGEIYLDFDVLGPSKDSSNSLDLVLIACRKDQIQPYLELLQQTNLVAKIVDIDCYALQRALIVMEPEATLSSVALLNLNFTLSSMIVVEKQNLVYAHNQTFQGQRLLSRIEEYKKTLGEQPIAADDENYMNVLRETLSSHLRHTMHFFYSSRTNTSVQKMILSGDCMTLPHIQAFIQQEIGMVTELANPFINTTMNPRTSKDITEKYASTWMLCCGLALSEPSYFS